MGAGAEAGTGSGVVVISVGATLLDRGDSWDAAIYDGQLHYRDAMGRLSLPLPRMQLEPGRSLVDQAGFLRGRPRGLDVRLVPRPIDLASVRRCSA